MSAVQLFPSITPPLNSSDQIRVEVRDDGGDDGGSGGEGDTVCGWMDGGDQEQSCKLV